VRAAPVAVGIHIFTIDPVQITVVSLFILAALVSLATSWLLVSRLERLGERVGMSEVVLGMVAALAADAPEITSAVSAISQHQQQVGAGVVLGSNVFNLAALLGLGAVVAGVIGLHRRVILFSGAVAIWVAAACLAAIAGLVSAVVGLVLALAGVGVYAVVLGAGPARLELLRLPRRWIEWLSTAITEEEAEVGPAVRARAGGIRDAWVAVASLAMVIAASVTMERAASWLGTQWAVPEIVVGGLVLAAVTSLPNAVAAVYLAARGKGPAALSTAVTSNNLNVAFGLLLPGAFLGLGVASTQTTLVTAWYIGLTAFTLLIAYRARGLRRTDGVFIIGAYAVFVGSVVTTASAMSTHVRLAIALALAVAVLLSGRLVLLRGAPSTLRELSDGHELGVIVRIPSAPCVVDRSGGITLRGWTPNRIWALSVALCIAVAAADALTGERVILIGLLILGPCCAVLTGRWPRTAVSGALAVGLAVLLGIPDGIWGTAAHLVFVGAVLGVALVSASGALVVERFTRRF
jgi:cation:H+ antiporter